MRFLTFINITIIFLLFILVLSQDPKSLTENKPIQDINDLQDNSQLSKIDSYIISLLIDHEKQFSNLKLANQELKTKLDTMSGRFDQEEKKVIELTGENANLKLGIQELKAKNEIVNKRLDLQEKYVNDLVKENANLKANLVKLQNQANGIKNDVLTTIQFNGLKIGNRWIIQEEGSNSYQGFIIRDQLCGKDCRYGFVAGGFKTF